VADADVGRSGTGTSYHRNLGIIEEATGKRPKGWLSWALARELSSHRIFSRRPESNTYQTTRTMSCRCRMRVKSGSLITHALHASKINDVPTIMGKGAFGGGFSRGMIREPIRPFCMRKAGRVPRIMSIFPAPRSSRVIPFA